MVFQHMVIVCVLVINVHERGCRGVEDGYYQLMSTVEYTNYVINLKLQ